MVSTISLNQVEELIEKLSSQDRLLLIERLAHRLREEAGKHASPSQVDEATLRLLTPDLAEAPASRGARLWREAALDQQRIVAACDVAMTDMCIQVEPIDALALRAMMLAEGVDPVKNQFSWGIIEMRDE